MAIADDVKSALRISAATTAYNIEVSDLIAAAQADLVLAGVLPAKAAVVSDPLVKRAIVAYCKAHFGWNNPDSDRLVRAYELLKMHLLLSGDYRGYTIAFTVTDFATGAAVVARVTFDNKTLLTNGAGEAVFAGVRPESQAEYSIAAAGYVPVVRVPIDVDGDKTLAVALIAS